MSVAACRVKRLRANMARNIGEFLGRLEVREHFASPTGDTSVSPPLCPILGTVASCLYDRNGAPSSRWRLVRPGKPAPAQARIALGVPCWWQAPPKIERVKGLRPLPPEALHPSVLHAPKMASSHGQAGSSRRAWFFEICKLGALNRA